MKQITLIGALLITFSYNSFYSQGVAISTTGINPSNSSMLDVSSTSKGILIPRLSLTGTTDATTITNGNVVSLLVYNTATVSDVTPGYYYWNGLVWKTLGEDADSDPFNEIELPASATTGQVLSWNGTAWIAQNSASGADNWGNDVVNTSGTNIAGNGTTGSPIVVTEIDGSITNEIQDLTLNITTNILTITNNGTPTNIDLTPYLDNTDAQNLTSTATGGNATVNISNGTSTTFSINDADSDPTNEIELPIGGTTGQVLETDGTGNYSWVNNTVSIAVGSGWKLTGNAGTTPGTNFLGTTDNQPLSIKVNNIEKVRVETNGTISTLNTGFSVFIGQGAGANDNLSNNQNVAIGYQALTSDTTGRNNTAIGYQALTSNTMGSRNTAIGYLALSSNINASSNTAIGYLALSSNTTKGYNTAIGYQALSFNIGGIFNTATGYQALLHNTTGGGNTANGNYALNLNRTGNYNTATGYQALYHNITGTRNTALGRRAFFNGASSSNSTALGYNANISGSNQIHLGDASITEVKAQVGFTTYSDARVKDNVKEDVVGLDFILKLRPVTYNFNIDRQNELMGITDSSDYKDKYDLEKIKMTGFLAQEVEKTAKEIGYDFSGVKIPKHDKELYGITYSEFVVPLVKGMQEQQTIIEHQQKEIDQLKMIVKRLIEKGEE